MIQGASQPEYFRHHLYLYHYLYLDTSGTEVLLRRCCMLTTVIEPVHENN